jgi:hypothetical protein
MGLITEQLDSFRINILALFRISAPDVDGADLLSPKFSGYNPLINTFVDPWIPITNDANKLSLFCHHKYKHKLSYHSKN